MKRNRDLEQRRALMRARVQNRAQQDNGMGGPFDMGSSVMPSMTVMPPMMQDMIAARLYATAWEASKIVDIPVDDVLREGWNYEGLNEKQTKRLRDREQALDVMGAFNSAMKIERLMGGAVIFMGVRDAQATADLPIGAGEVSWLTVFARHRVSVARWNNDPLSPTYGRPDQYRIDGHLIHSSRLIIFDGQPLSKRPDSILNPPDLSRNDGFGYSKLLGIYDDIMRSPGTRQAAYQLVNRASVIIAEMELSGEGDGDMSPGLQAIKDVINQISIYRGAAIDKDPMAQGKAISTMSASFGSVPELVITFLQVLSAASDIPATRFIGQAPGGLNATGESDLENYYGRLESLQKQRLGPQLMQVLQRMEPALQGLEWPPLWSLSEQEEATVRSTDAATVTGLVSAGLLSDQEGIAELRHRGVISAPGVGVALAEPDAVEDLEDSEAQLTAVQAALSNADPAQ